MNKEEFDVEKGLNRLAEINNMLSDAQLPLGEAMKLYKEGMELSEKCRESLEDVKKEIEVINNGSNQ